MLQTSNGTMNQSQVENKRSMLTPEQSAELKKWLIAVALKRDKQAFAFLFKSFAPKIKSFGYKQFNSEALASDLLQETMSLVWRKAHLYNADKGAVTTWVYTIMRNLSFDMLRKMQTSKEDCLSDDIWPIVDAHAADSDTEAFSDHLLKQQLAKYADALPEAQKQVVHGMYFNELTQEELAHQLNIPLGTVKSRLRLALGKLKQQMEKNS
ncbi:RNA polymerase sigma factor [Catenovulum agarivorans DS-2]|uniref:RNA polymerase sigma factor n=1 Tax=Catenovulum agarivorans DS-2 TaxID=1328313 RepID=W7QKB9_9ALTE|nr:sigma-70 family RNA polymerase sigma factor [Catenovulum agarivorans]EWH09397.1 RNA polymerase sigma factor [Catenovulum agarivorans DS-2]